MKQSIYLDEISPFRYRYSRNDPEASSGQVQVHVIMNNVKQSTYLDEISPFRYRYSRNDI